MVVANKNIYRDLGELPIYNFYKCRKGKLEYLYEEKKGDVTNELIELWGKLLNDFCELTLSSRQKRYYKTLAEIEFLEKRLIFVPNILNLITKTPVYDRAEYYDALKDWKTPINPKKDLDKEIERVINILNNSTNKINRKKDEIKAYDKQAEDLNDSNISLESLQIKLSRALGLQINVHECSVAQWVANWEEVKNIKPNGE